MSHFQTFSLRRPWQCNRCHYHYPAEQIVIVKPLRLECADRERCDRNLATRERDRW